MIPDPETTKEVAKATKAVADASGKLVDAARDAGGFIARFLTRFTRFHLKRRTALAL